MMMILLLGAAGAIVVVASFISKNSFKKSMVELRAKEDAYREKVSKFRSQEAEALSEGDTKTMDIGGGGMRVVLETVRDVTDELRGNFYAPSRLVNPGEWLVARERVGGFVYFGHGDALEAARGAVRERQSQPPKTPRHGSSKPATK
ncbi:hypothetical protein P3C58_18875 [Mesorhizobium sp. XAP10]|uniref:hypothetical protein n=1 Tax=unclassified Mesorhizobium TaxID=325217 RepID=UPI0023DF9A9D|nr:MULTISPECIES: hypothetical protein [unclassified Mesorhizobium]MDF3154046.1 hypothetical protein [Mesorhizobium sp. XAP10]MDF3247185.1 hypothetical protein [Mesorhizobium sp. XAP4]